MQWLVWDGYFELSHQIPLVWGSAQNLAPSNFGHVYSYIFQTTESEANTWHDSLRKVSDNYDYGVGKVSAAFKQNKLRSSQISFNLQSQIYFSPNLAKSWIIFPPPPRDRIFGIYFSVISAHLSLILTPHILTSLQKITLGEFLSILILTMKYPI